VGKGWIKTLFFLSFLKFLIRDTYMSRISAVCAAFLEDIAKVFRRYPDDGIAHPGVPETQDKECFLMSWNMNLAAANYYMADMARRAAAVQIV
jgi:hypothetical protein